MLIGREPERLVLAAALERARRGDPQTVVVVGEPGIGKTALLDDLRASAGDALVLEAAGAEAEEAIALAGLVALLAPVRSCFAALDPPHGDVLTSLVTTGEPAPMLTMGLAVLELAASLSEQRTVLVLLDDAHWLDDLSVDVLGFVRRRLHGHRVAVVAAVRPGRRRWGPDEDLLELELGGLDGPDVGTLLRASGAEVVDEVADRCRDACGGNPLALIELGRTLTTEQRRGRRPLPALVPVGDRLHRWLVDRVAGLPVRTRRALLVVALAGHIAPAALAGALARVGLVPADLDEAETSGAIRRDRGAVALAHPLFGSTAVEVADPADRRAAHRALAAVLPDEALERRAWHLAEGCEGAPDEAVAALRRVAERATEQGAHLVAADAWDRVAGLLTSPEERASALVAAGRAAWDAGRPDLAVPVLRSARALVPPGDIRAVATRVLGEVLGWAASIEEGRRLLESEVVHVERDSPDIAVSLLVSSARLASLAAAPEAVALAERAERLAAGGGEVTRVTARTIGTHVRLVAGQGRTLERRLRELDALGALVEHDVGRPLVELAQLLGFDLMVRERWVDARTTFAKAVDASRVASLAAEETFASAMAAEVAWRTGQWSEARSEAAVDVAFHAPLADLRGTFGDATLARVEAALGLGDAARRRALVAVERGDQLGMASLAAWGRHALGFAAVADGRFEDAVSILDWIWHLERSGGVTDPGVLWWHGDLLEALLATGRRDEATRLVDQLDERAATTGRVWASAVAARGRGQLTGDPVALRRSVELLDGLGAPFEAARSRLALAALGDPLDRDVLDAARTTFEALGARPWIARAGAPDDRTERPAATVVAAVLSPAELRVALAVGRGLTNRQAADALALSARTVDAHLQAIYRKLGIHTRTQLALRLGAPGG